MEALAGFALKLYRAVREKGGSEEEATRIVQAYLSVGLLTISKEAR